jgi:hypothetical protein
MRPLSAVRRGGCWRCFRTVASQFVRARREHCWGCRTPRRGALDNERSRGRGFTFGRGGRLPRSQGPPYMAVDVDVVPGKASSKPFGEIKDWSLAWTARGGGRGWLWSRRHIPPRSGGSQWQRRRHACRNLTDARPAHQAVGSMGQTRCGGRAKGDGRRRQAMAAGSGGQRQAIPGHGCCEMVPFLPNSCERRGWACEGA